jgi:transcriptional regulator with XRE-family HTH domain
MLKLLIVKHSKTTSAITNRLKALAEEMGYNVSYVSKFENGGEMFMAGKSG